MADYYPLIARAITVLDKSTGEARRAIYERARTALVAQLRSADPPLTEEAITTERLSLEEAIRKVEADAARRAREEDRSKSAEKTSEGTARVAGPAATGRPDARQSGLRDVVKEAAQLGGAASKASHSAREAYGAVGSPSARHERLDPRLDEDATAEEFPRDPEIEIPTARHDMGSPGPLPSYPTHDDDTIPSGRLPRAGRGRGMVIALLVLLVAGGLGAAAFYAGPKIILALKFATAPSPAPKSSQIQVPNAQPPKKIPDRIGQNAQTPGENVNQANVAQRAVLFEQVPNSTEKRQFVGSVIWHNEQITPAPGQPTQTAIKADIDIPDLALRLSWIMSRNADASLPASHTIQIIFGESEKFQSSRVANIPGILMDVPEQNKGVPLAGLSVKVTNGFFLIGLSSVDVDVQRNVSLLKDRPWMDIPIVFTDGTRALLAVEKGTPGERAFADAFAAWKQ